MEDTPDILDSYSAPEQVGPAARTGLTSGVKAIAIIGVVLGAFGLAAAAMGGLGLVFSGRMQSLFGGASVTAGDQNAVRLQKEMQRRVAETSRRFRAAVMARVVSQGVVASLMLVGGIMVLMAKARGRAIFRVACGLAILYQLGSTALNSAIQVSNVGIMRDMSQQMFGAGQGGPPPDMMSNVMTAAMYAGLAIALAFALVKIAYYVIAVVVLGKASVRAQFTD